MADAGDARNVSETIFVARRRCTAGVGKGNDSIAVTAVSLVRWRKDRSGVSPDRRGFFSCVATTAVDATEEEEEDEEGGGDRYGVGTPNTMILIGDTRVVAEGSGSGWSKEGLEVGSTVLDVGGGRGAETALFGIACGVGRRGREGSTESAG